MNLRLVGKKKTTVDTDDKRTPQERLNELFLEAFDTNHPAMLDYAALCMEIKRLRKDRERLIAAARKIDCLANQQECRTKELILLAKDVREGADPDEIARRKKNLESLRVIDFSSAIMGMRAALADCER